MNYILLKRQHAVLKEKGKYKQIYLRSILPFKLKFLAGDFTIIRSHNISEMNFDDYLNSLGKIVLFKEKRADKAIFSIYQPF